MCNTEQGETKRLAFTTCDIDKHRLKMLLIVQGFSRLKLAFDIICHIT